MRALLKLGLHSALPHSFSNSSRVERPVIVHYKTQTNHAIEPDLGCFWGPKMDGRRDHCTLAALEIAWFGAEMQKKWLLMALRFIVSKPISTNQLLDLSSSNANPKTHIQHLTRVSNPCHHQIFSSSNPSTSFERTNTYIQWLRWTLKIGQHMFDDQYPNHMLNPKTWLLSHATPLQNPKPFPQGLSSLSPSLLSHASIPNQSQLISFPFVSYFHSSSGGKN